MTKTPDKVGSKADAVFYVRGSEAPTSHVLWLDGTPLGEPLETKALLPGPKGSVLQLYLKPSQLIPAHRFAHDTIYYMLSGRIRVRLAGRDYEAEARDGWSAAAGVEAELECLEASVLLEWMAPPHIIWGDRLVTWGPVHPAESHLFARWKDIDDFKLRQVEGETNFGPGGQQDAGHRVKVLIPGPYGSLAWLAPRAKKWGLHTHQHHWLAYQIKGKTRGRFGGDVDFLAEAGDAFAAQAGAEHSNEHLEDNELVEFKWPAPLMFQGVVHSWEPR